MTTETSKTAATVQTYLFFDGKCEEALEFYKKAVGAEVSFLMRFKDAPQDGSNPSEGCAGPMPPGDKVMHGEVQIGNTKLMVSDGQCSGQGKFEGFSLSVTAKDDADAERIFKTLGEGGQVQMPLGKTFFASSFGMVADRFGVSWMVYVAPEEPNR